MKIIIRVRTDNKLCAVKCLKEITGLGLKEAKDCIDAEEFSLESVTDEAEAVEFRTRMYDNFGAGPSTLAISWRYE